MPNDIFFEFFLEVGKAIVLLEMVSIVCSQEARHNTPFVSGAPSSYDTKAEYSEKVAIHLPDYNEDLVGGGNKNLDPFKLSASLCIVRKIYRHEKQQTKWRFRSCTNIISVLFHTDIVQTVKEKV